MRSMYERVSSASYLPVANIDKVPGNGGCCGHLRRHQMCASAASLAAFKVAVAGRSAALAGGEDVGFQPQAHGAPRLPPLKACLAEDAVQPLFLRLRLHRLRAG